MNRSAEFATGGNPTPFKRQVVKGATQDEVVLGNVTALHSDEELATHAGFSGRHHGYGVQRHKDEGSATVSLWKA